MYVEVKKESAVDAPGLLEIKKAQVDRYTDGNRNGVFDFKDTNGNFEHDQGEKVDDLDDITTKYGDEKAFDGLELTDKMRQLLSLERDTTPGVINVYIVQKLTTPVQEEDEDLLGTAIAPGRRPKKTPKGKDPLDVLSGYVTKKDEPYVNSIIIQNTGEARVFAHEIGHLLQGFLRTPQGKTSHSKDKRKLMFSPLEADPLLSRRIEIVTENEWRNSPLAMPLVSKNK
jgi:hypothetical protein